MYLYIVKLGAKILLITILYEWPHRQKNAAINDQILWLKNQIEYNYDSRCTQIYLDFITVSGLKSLSPTQLYLLEVDGYPVFKKIIHLPFVLLMMSNEDSWMEVSPGRWEKQPAELRPTPERPACGFQCSRRLRSILWRLLSDAAKKEKDQGSYGKATAHTLRWGYWTVPAATFTLSSESEDVELVQPVLLFSPPGCWGLQTKGPSQSQGAVPQWFCPFLPLHTVLLLPRPLKELNNPGFFSICHMIYIQGLSLWSASPVKCSIRERAGTAGAICLVQRRAGPQSLSSVNAVEGPWCPCPRRSHWLLLISVTP